MTIGIAY